MHLVKLAPIKWKQKWLLKALPLAEHQSWASNGGYWGDSRPAGLGTESR